MSIETDRLIEDLVRRSQPVAPLRHPAWRATLMIAAAGASGAAALMIMGSRTDLAGKLSDPGMTSEWAAAILTGVLAAVAAFLVALPDRRAAWSLLPAPALAWWLASIGYGASNALEQSLRTLQTETSFGCLVSIALISTPVTMLMIQMLRHAASIRPRLTIGLGVLATSSLASAAVSLFHHLDATLMILLWHGGSAALLVLVATTYSQRLFAFAGRIL